MKTWTIGAMAFLFAVCAPWVAAQDEDTPDEEDDGLTPADAMELLGEAHDLMGAAEELLNDSSRGKALETEKDLLKKLEKEDPEFVQKQILEKIGRLVQKAEEKEKGVVDKLNEILKNLRASKSSSQSKQKQQQQQGQGQQVPKQPGQPAQKPYDPGRTEQPSKFRSMADRTGTWGNLPPAVRAAMLASEKSELPPEFHEMWKEYSQKLAGENK
ncbi:MAG: hypothetical protein HY716_02780 [Planctomycetes bacterium]|nr:hypothetical protein [Planctomycetota bacterium]